jgi:hypothetical protein
MAVTQRRLCQVVFVGTYPAHVKKNFSTLLCCTRPRSRAYYNHGAQLLAHRSPRREHPSRVLASPAYRLYCA